MQTPLWPTREELKACRPHRNYIWPHLIRRKDMTASGLGESAREDLALETGLEE